MRPEANAELAQFLKRPENGNLKSSRSDETNEEYTTLSGALNQSSHFNLYVVCVPFLS